MTTIRIERLPTPLQAYRKIVKSMVLKARSTPQRALPDLEYVVERLTIDLDHLQRYAAICQFASMQTLPPTYLAVLSQSLQMLMMAEPEFPFPVLGLVHIHNQVSQNRPVKPSETIRLSCRFGTLKPHEKGLQFEFLTTAKVGDEEVWTGSSTYLMRQKSSTAESRPAPRQEKVARKEGDRQENWTVPGDIGRRYGLISGDINPIHLHPLSAKLFGFPKAIAHGMWTKARCVAALGKLPDAFDIDVQFKLPVLLPASVEFHAQPAGQQVAFELTDARNGKPHLAGTLTQR